MPRVTQECDFTIHEDEGSVCSSAGDNIESPEDHEARESLGGQTDDSYLEEPAADAATNEYDDDLDDKENSLAHSHTDYEEEEGGDSYLEEPVADAGTHEDDSQLDYTECSVVHHRVSDGWEDEGDSYLDQEQPETDSAGHENADQHDDTEGSIAYSHAGDDSYAEQHDQHDGALQPAEPSEHPADAESQEPTSKRDSATSDSHRRSSGRTDALIQAAAKAVVARIEKHRNTPDQPDQPEAPEDGPDFSILSNTTDGDRAEQEKNHAESAEAHGTSPRATPVQDDAGGDSSSHNGADDDVFSDRSPRSSLGSAPSDPERKRASGLTQGTRSPRISNMSMYDGDEAFVPTCRATPRPPFRSPSYVKAMQMASPPASVYGSPRSSRRHYNGGSLGSPGQVQYSPRGRSTPTRFKAKEAPLVLLHVTLLPLAWPWGDVLEGAEELGEGAKGLRDAWRMLQSRMGDTVLERGVLLPHPQGDYEVLEERVLESLELPLRRRARILECGHYLGPSNEMTLEDSDSEEDDGGRPSSAKATHWCGTCKHDIRYEALGEGRVFRVKVYASNGLMGAGAWGACWREMERVDVEIEPWVDGDGQGELARLAAEQARREEEEEEMYMEGEGYDTEFGEESHVVEESVQERESMAVDRHHNISSPAPPSHRQEKQSRSLLSPAQRILASPSPGTREQSTSVIRRGPAHVVPATPNHHEMQLEERASTGHRHRESRMLDPPADLDDRALPGPQRRLLHSPPNAETQLERSHSSVSHRSAPRAQRQGHARMQIEDRASVDVSREPRAENPFPTPDAQRDPPHPDTERRRRDEERLREIYGHTPPRSHEESPSPGRHGDLHSSSLGHDDLHSPPPRHEDSYIPETDHHEASYAPGTDRHEDSYIPGPSPPSPSQQAFERREERRRAYQAASLPELLLEAARVFVGDGRNVVIFLLGVVVLGLAVRGGGQHEIPFADLVGREVPDVKVAHAESPGAEKPGEHVEVVEAAGAPVEEAAPVREHASKEPEALQMTEREREVVRVVETITETVRVSTGSEVEVEVETESVFEVEVETQAEVIPSESASSSEAGDEASVEDAQVESGVDELQAGVESGAESTPTESVADELQGQGGVESKAESTPSESVADELQAGVESGVESTPSGSVVDEPEVGVESGQSDPPESVIDVPVEEPVTSADEPLSEPSADVPEQVDAHDEPSEAPADTPSHEEL